MRLGLNKKTGKIEIFVDKFKQTFDARKQKADSLVFAFSGSRTIRPFSSSRHRYRPVVMWRTRKDWPHFMWLPLQLQRHNRHMNYQVKNIYYHSYEMRDCLTRFSEAQVSTMNGPDYIPPHLHTVQS